MALMASMLWTVRRHNVIGPVLSMITACCACVPFFFVFYCAVREYDGAKATRVHERGVSDPEIDLHVAGFLQSAAASSMGF